MLDSYRSDPQGIFCYLDPKIGNHDRFVEIYHYLKDISPPVYYYDKESGYTIQKCIDGDYGMGYYDAMSDAMSGEFGITYANPDGVKEYLDGYPWDLNDEFEFFGDAIKLLDSILNADIPNLKKLQEQELINQMKSFEKIYLNTFLEMSIFENAAQKENLKNLIQVTANKLKEQPYVNCHTDFEGRNILVCYEEEKLYIIDYQDMCIGPAGIDLAGIFFDHYICDKLHLNKTLLIKQLDNLKYLKSGKYSFKNNELYDFARWGCIQRNMRILGTLSNLYLQKDRSFRLKDLATILDNLIFAIPSEFQELKDYFKKNVSPRNDQRCKEILR